MNFSNLPEAFKNDKPEMFFEISLFYQLHRNNGLPKGNADLIEKSAFVHPAHWGVWAACQAYSVHDIRSSVEPGPVSVVFRRIFKIHAVGTGRTPGRALEEDAEAMMILFIEIACGFLLALLGGMSGAEIYLSSHVSIARARRSVVGLLRGSLSGKDLERQKKRDDRLLLFGKRDDSSSSDSELEDPVTPRPQGRKRERDSGACCRS